VYKGFSDQGPFESLNSARIEGENPYELVDSHPEPGRTQVYRIAVADRGGLEEDLDTLRVDVTGTPSPVMRAPAPNPAAGPVSVGFFLPPGGAGGDWRLTVFDVAGRRVAVAASGGFGPEGIEAHAVWDLRRDDGRRVAGGLYFLRLDATTTRADGSSASRTFSRRVAVLP
jgi:hypothetical protein